MRGAGLLIVGVRGAELCATCCGEHPWSSRRMLPDLRANLKRAGRANNRGTAGVPRFAGVLGAPAVIGALSGSEPGPAGFLPGRRVNGGVNGEVL